MFLADPKELVKFVNSTMNTNHNPETSNVVQLKTEHIKAISTDDGSKSKMTYDKVVADMLFSIDGKVYGIEFQTVHDNTILCRIAEYQFNAMIDMVKSSGFSNEYEGEIPLPRMTMIQLERSNNVPGHYKLWFVNEDTREKILQQFPIVKMWEHHIDDLSQNGMHLLLPFKIIDIRKNIKGNEMDENTTVRFLEMSEQVDSEIMDRRKVVTREDILHEGVTQGEQRERREILNTLAQLKVPFDVFKATAEARGVPEEEYLPIYNVVVGGP